MKSKILIAEDNTETIDIYKNIIQEMGYDCEITTNGNDALEQIKKTEYHLLITNLTLPPMSGNDLITKAKAVNESILCIVASDINDPEIVISSMRDHNAFDFIIKPITPSLLSKRIENAIEVFKLKKKIKDIVASEDEHFKQILQIFDWKKELQQKQFESLASKIIRQINIGLFHGGGFGGLMSTLSLVFSKIQKNESTKKYEISENHISLLKENYLAAKTLVNGFSKAQTILMNTSHFTEKISLLELPEIFEKLKNKIRPMLGIKFQSLVISSLPLGSGNYWIVFHKELMEAAFTELFINAMKYSNTKDKIYLLQFVNEDEFEIKIINSAIKNSDGTIGVPTSAEQMIFEPFYRMSTVAYEGYTLEEFGAGIGLPVVKKILELHKASIHIFTIKNFIEDKNNMNVSVSIRFPIVYN